MARTRSTHVGCQPDLYGRGESGEDLALVLLLDLELMAGKVEEREFCDTEGLLNCLRVTGHAQKPLRQRESVKRRRKCFLTLGVNTQKRRAFTKPWPESPIPCRGNEVIMTLHTLRKGHQHLNKSTLYLNMAFERAVLQRCVRLSQTQSA